MSHAPNGSTNYNAIGRVYREKLGGNPFGIEPDTPPKPIWYCDVGGCNQSHDPNTGEVLDVQTTPMGTLTLTVVRDKISTGNFAGSGTPVVGDIVRK